MCMLVSQSGRPAHNPEPTALQRALERCGQQPTAQRTKPAAAGEHVVATDRFERLLAEAEECIRARSVSPCMLKGMPGPGTSPTCNMPAPRPITPLQLGQNAVDAVNSKVALPRSLLGVDVAVPPQHEAPRGMASFMLPAAALPQRGVAAAAAEGYGRSRDASLAHALAAAAAAEANSPEGAGEDVAMAQEASPNSHLDATASNAGSMANHADAYKMHDVAGDGGAAWSAGTGAAAGNFPHGEGGMRGHRVVQHAQQDADGMQEHMQVRTSYCWYTAQDISMCCTLFSSGAGQLHTAVGNDLDPKCDCKRPRPYASPGTGALACCTRLYGAFMTRRHCCCCLCRF